MVCAMCVECDCEEAADHRCFHYFKFTKQLEVVGDVRGTKSRCVRT
jgi:hypothetical protein